MAPRHGRDRGRDRAKGRGEKDLKTQLEHARLGAAALGDVEKMSQYVVFVAARATRTAVDIGAARRDATANQKSPGAAKLTVRPERVGP